MLRRSPAVLLTAPPDANAITPTPGPEFVRARRCRLVVDATAGGRSGAEAATWLRMLAGQAHLGHAGDHALIGFPPPAQLFRVQFALRTLAPRYARLPPVPSLHCVPLHPALHGRPPYPVRSTHGHPA